MKSLHISERPVLQGQSDYPTPHVGYDFDSYMKGLTGITGQSCRLHLRDGLDVSGFDLLLETSTYTSHMKAEPCVALHVMLEGSGHGEVYPESTNQTLYIPYKPGTAYISVIREPVTGCSVVPPNSSFKGIDIRFTFSFLDRLHQSELLSALNQQHPAHLTSTDTIWIGTLANDRQIDLATHFLIDTIFGPPDNDLLIESSALTVLSTILDRLKLSEKSNEDRPLTQKEQRSISAVQVLLTEDLSVSWTIRELSRHAGLNEKRLKTGFKTLFGQSIGRYIQRQRLEKARQLLQNTDCNVTEASLSVGYTNPSHFAHLFKREFGHSPSKMKNIELNKK